MTLFRLLLILSCFTSQLSFGQATDSLQFFIDKSQYEDLTIREYDSVLKACSRLQQYANGLVYSEKFMDLCLQLKDTSALGTAINYKAANLADLGRYEEGIEFCEASRPYFRGEKDRNFQLLCFKWSVMCYYTNRSQEALDIHKKVTDPDLTRRHIFKGNISMMYAAVGKYDTAMYYLDQIIADNDFAYPDEKTTTYINLANYSSKRGNYEEALKYLDSAYNYEESLRGYRKLKGYYREHFNAYQGLGQTLKAREALDSMQKYSELRYRMQYEEEIAALRVAESRESNLRQKVKVVDGKIEQYEKWIVLWVFFGIVLILVIVFVFLYRNIKAKSDLVVLEQKLLRSQMTPHFIFNSLSVIQGMILDDKNSKAINYLTKFSRLLRLILENSRDKLVSLGDEINASKNYLELQALQMKQPLRFHFEVDEQIQVHRVLIPPMLIQPFIENAVEHGFRGEVDAPEVNVRLRRREKTLICEITDNGKGIDGNESSDQVDKKSLSTAITSERLAILSKAYKVKTSLEVIDRKETGKSGVFVRLILPYIED